MRLIARNYDRRAASFGDRPDDDFPELGRFLTGGERLLDIGCGAGGSLRRFLLYHGSPRLCFGLDISEGMLRKAVRSSCDELPQVPSYWMLGDAESLPFGAGSFDFAISVNAVSHLNDLAAVFQGAFRTLRPGGGLAVKFKGDLSLLRPVEAAFREALACAVDAAKLRPILAMFDPASAQQARREARHAGFEQVKVATRRDERFIDPEAEIPRFIAIVGYVLEALSADERKAVEALFAVLVRRRAGPGGLADFSYSVTVNARRPR